MNAHWNHKGYIVISYTRKDIFQLKKNSGRVSELCQIFKRHKESWYSNPYTLFLGKYRVGENWCTCIIFVRPKSYTTNSRIHIVVLLSRGRRAVYAGAWVSTHFPIISLLILYFRFCLCKLWTMKVLSKLYNSIYEDVILLLHVIWSTHITHYPSATGNTDLIHAK